MKPKWAGGGEVALSAIGDRGQLELVRGRPLMSGETAGGLRSLAPPPPRRYVIVVVVLSMRSPRPPRLPRRRAYDL